jgi:ATP-dependent Zn protease
VIVIAATNFASSLDNALVRPGRFDRTVTVSNPDVLGRQQILESHFKGVARAPDVDLNVIARGTPGMSGADLANLVNVAALKAAQEDLPVRHSPHAASFLSHVCHATRTHGVHG